MAAITAGMVKELREKTDAGMMDCKSALTETAGDMEAAVESVLKYSQDAEALRRVGANARAYITRHRQWRNNILQLVEFHQAIGQGSTGQTDIRTA